MTFSSKTGQTPADEIEYGITEETKTLPGKTKTEQESLNYGNKEIITHNPKQGKKEREKITFANLQKFKITPEKIQEYTPEWLVDGFLVKRTLVNIYARGGAGKSYFVLNLCKWLLEKR